jgi:HD-like signal output (HDOD) protein
VTTATPADPVAHVDDIVSRVSELGTLPEVVARINTIINDPDSDVADLEEIVRHDPALVTRMMKMVNSAFYGNSQPIASVERAITMLGFNSIQRLALAASIGQMFKGKLCNGFSAKDLWSHCIGVGVVARDLAMRINRALAEEVFLAGMTHDIGLLAALQVAPEKLAAVCDKAAQDPRYFCDIEREIIGVDHQQLGAALAKQWQFPASCQLAAGRHHEPDNLDPQQQLIVGLVHVADVLCCQEKIGFNRTALRQRFNNALLGRLGLNQEMIEDTQQRLTALAWSAITIFK